MRSFGATDLDAGKRRGGLVMPIVIIWGMMLLLGVWFVWLEDGFAGTLSDYYLLPWALLSSVVVLSPSLYLYFKGKFDPFHPLVFAAWSYIFPAFCIGGVIVAFHLVDPYFLVFIDDPQYNLPLSLVYISVGFIGLTAGYAVPIGRFIAERLEVRLPNWQWQPSRVWAAGLLLLLAGIGVNLIGFVQGLIGYQRVTDYGTYDALIYFLLVLLSEGSMLLWLAIFSTRRKTGVYYIVLVVLILFIPFRAALLGSRSGLVLSMFPIAMAFKYSGRKLGLRNSFIFGTLIVLAVCIGIIYGTSFRNIKGSESRVEAGDYVGQIGATIDYLATQDPAILLRDSAQAMADRVENLSSVAVVVANYERLAPYEASYGLENNIINDTLTSFVPRFLWADKPPTSDARAYSTLYFNYSDNSFAISPFADLLRNFGPIGIPIGMFLLGIYLRIIYRLFVETPTPSMWKYVAYVPLLTLVSYESFYATIFPSIIRTLAVILISFFFVNLVVKLRIKAD